MFGFFGVVDCLVCGLVQRNFCVVFGDVCVFCLFALFVGLIAFVCAGCWFGVSVVFRCLKLVWCSGCCLGCLVTFCLAYVFVFCLSFVGWLCLGTLMFVVGDCYLCIGVVIACWFLRLGCWFVVCSVSLLCLLFDYACWLIDGLLIVCV